MIARRAGGEPVELVRSPEEVVFLAFDSHIKRLVELHVLRSGTTLNSVPKRAAFERARQASDIRGGAFMRILDVGEDQGLVYYTTNLNDGEFVRDYTGRRGALPAATVLCLVYQLLDELIQLQERHRWLVAHMRLDRVVVSTLEDTFLQLRVYDYGLSSSDETECQDDRRMVIQACELLCLMLTGKDCGGDNPDRYHALTGLPMDLRTTIRTALTDPANAPTSLERVREGVREAYGALVSNIQARSARKQLVVTPALQPRSQLQDLLLENVPVETILGNRFHVEDADHVRRYPFSIPCVNARNDQPVTVHLLPPSRIVDKAQYDAVPLQTWRFDADRHPNILRSYSLWESPDWTFLTEEREPGFTLSRLMAERIMLNPAEVLVVMRQVRAGMDQALECGVQRVDLHPSNIVLRVGKAGPLLNREYDRLMQKRLDAWPHFLVKLRAHLTMRNLYEPLLVDKPEGGEHPEIHLADRDYRHRAFVALAAYLLTGERQTTSGARFPEALQETLVSFVRETLDLTREVGRTPSPTDFLEEFEAKMNGPAQPDLATRLRGASIAVEEMESAGSVSDFDNEWACSGAESLEDDEPRGPVAQSLSVAHFSGNRGKRQPWPVWAAAAAVALTMAGWWQWSGGSASAPTPTIAAAAAAVQPPDPVPSAAEPPAKLEPSPEPAPAAHPKEPSLRQVATMVRKSETAAVEAAPKTPPPPVFASLQPDPEESPAFVPAETKKEAILVAAAPEPESEPLPVEIKAAVPGEPIKAEPPAKDAASALAMPPVVDRQAHAALGPEWKTPVPIAPVLAAPQAPTLEAMVATTAITLASPAPAAAELKKPARRTQSEPVADATPQPDPVIIRKAIMPTPEEIAKYNQVKGKTRAETNAAPAQEVPEDLPKNRLSRR
ncbi:MAG TPA: hypothetical protein VD994_06665 [Prosthecobacter sp.]|nr:hypothetical protein [Prosthecobacter sp.]